MNRRACVGTVIAVLLASVSSASVAAESRFGPFVVDSEQPSVIRLKGQIGPLELFNFSDAKRATTEPRSLVLDSPGGSIIVALTIAETIAEEGFTTVVPEDAQCLSACAFLFFAGESREVHGKLGVHQIASTKSADVSFTQTVLARVSRFFQQTKTSPEVFTVMLTTPPDQMHAFDDAEIERLAINRGGGKKLSEEQLEAVRRCDELAGDPNDSADSGRVGGGALLDTPADQIIDACEIAVAAKPDEPRLKFQLAQALNALDRTVDAAKWYRDAAEQGHAVAQDKIGNMYYHGEGVSRDRDKAAEWFRQSAENGNSSAQYRFGLMYYFGENVTKDIDKATYWFRKAAGQGNAEAQQALQRLNRS
tara:strand:+ start:1130 stop:2221 length:1092 start_codon:yes stop_codon:yes gene_type:complete